MRGFVAIITITIIIGLFAARQQLVLKRHVLAADVRSDTRISEIVSSGSMERITINLQPPAPKPPVNTSSTEFVGELSALNAVVVDNKTDVILFYRLR